MQVRQSPWPTAFRLWPLGLVWLGLAGPQSPAMAFDGPSATSAPGAWDISEAEGPRKCRIMLRAGTGESQAASIGMPAGCRRAFPFLGQAGVWSVSTDHRLALTDRDGRVVLAFAPADEDRLVATGPDGETYELQQVGRPRPAKAVQPVAAPSGPPGPSPIRPLAPHSKLPAAGELPTTTLVAASSGGSPSAGTANPVAPVVAYPERPNDIAGRYAILREGDRDVGCLLTLDGAARGPGGHKAQLAPACRDQGIVVFDPVGWRFDRGHLILRARKGHDLRLQYHSDGVWRKDPRDGGNPIGLKKI